MENVGVPVGWAVVDPDGNVLQSGEATIIKVDVAEEIAQRLAEVAAADSSGEGEVATWLE